MNAKLVVETNDSSPGAGVAPGTARVHAEIDGHRFVVADCLFYGTQDDYTGGTDYAYRVELHRANEKWIVRVVRFEEIHYGASSERTEISALEEDGTLRRLPDDTALSDATLVDKISG